MVMSYVKKLIETSIKRVFIKQHFVVKPPGAVLTTINANFVSEISMQNPEMYLTLFFGILDRSDFSFEYSSAGIHVPPLVVRDGAAEELFTTSDIPIGYDRNHQYETDRTRFSPGDAFVFVTDGIVDASRDGTRFGVCCLKKEVLRIRAETADSLPDELLKSVHGFLGEKRIEDDMCALSMEFHGRDEENPRLAGTPIMG